MSDTKETVWANRAPVCPYCEMPARLVDGLAIYPHRPDLGDKQFWLCAPCDAYVGCHVKGAYVWENSVKIVSDGTMPLGRLADAELRRAKSAVHRLLDPMWATGSMSRSQAYTWLAKRMKINKDQCHIGLFDLRTCDLAVKILRGGAP